VIEQLLKDWDGESVIVHYDPPTGSWIFIAVHSTVLGPGTGGTRMRSYSSPETALGDALKLSAAMTFKFAVPGFPRGGAKAVIAVPAELTQESRSDLLRRYGRLVGQLGGLFYTGPDVGTSPADMDIIAETGAPYVHSCTEAAGGAGSSGPATALGVFAGIQVACERLFGTDSLEGRRVLVQGVGGVGETLVELLLNASAEVLFSEVDDVLIRCFRDDVGLQYVPPEDVYSTECDIYSPCALGGVLNGKTIPLLKCRIVVGGANNQLADESDAQRLQERGILYAPDYVVNLGGAMAITGIEALGWSRSEADEQVVSRIRTALRKVFELSAGEGITTEAAARRLAEERLAAGK
jgi:leucine dehydrogenase